MNYEASNDDADADDLVDNLKMKNVLHRQRDAPSEAFWYYLTDWRASHVISSYFCYNQRALLALLHRKCDAGTQRHEKGLTFIRVRAWLARVLRVQERLPPLVRTPAGLWRTQARRDTKKGWLIHGIWATIVAQPSACVGTVSSLVDIFMALGLHVAL